MKIKTGKLTENKTRTVVTVFSVLFLLMLVLQNVLSNNSISTNNTEWLSNLSMVNGINATRGYGQELGLSSIIAKSLFNKSFYFIVFVLKFLSFVFSLFMAGVSFLIH